MKAQRAERDPIERLGRVPPGLAPGSRRREQKAKSCEHCEGDLWVEVEGAIVPCRCRSRRAANRARNRLRVGGWWQGTSLSFAAPPLAQVPAVARDTVESLGAAVKAGQEVPGLWLVGGEGSGKSALCAYLAQRLYPGNHAQVERVGDLLARLRWLGAVKGDLAVERQLERLIQTPLLVLDDVDRIVRSHPSSRPLALRASCSGHDLIRLALVLRERCASLKPVVLTSRAEPHECAARVAAISRPDLVRGLLATAQGAADPFETFPAYPEALLAAGFDDIRDSCTPLSLDDSEDVAAAA